MFFHLYRLLAIEYVQLKVFTMTKKNTETNTTPANALSGREARDILTRCGHEVVSAMGVIFLEPSPRGLKIWRAVDTLCNHHGFRVVPT